MRWLVLAVAMLAAAGARADPPLHRADPVIVAPALGRADVPVARTLYLDRCVGGCTVHGTMVDDATTSSSSIPETGTYQLGAFAYSDAEWAAIVACVTEVYSPYAITITETEPSASTYYNKALVAGLPTDVKLDTSTLGIALLSGDCHPLGNSLAFVFANVHPHDATFVTNVCWTVTQESAHLYGLDHEFVFTDGVSACRDPMTYRGDCGGEKFFRPHEAFCGRVAEEHCRCGEAQSSHRLLVERFGSAAPTTAPPEVVITQPPGPGSLAAGASIVAHASAQRGIDHVALLLNGYPWVTVPGVAFGGSGQPGADYTLALPADVPDGVIDVAVAAYDDLGTVTTTPALTMTKGEPCASAATCAAHQSCSEGRCAWAPPTAALDDECEYVQQCASGLCIRGRCSQACDIDDATTCPEHFACDGIGSNTDGVCSRTSAEAAGCCDAGGSPAGGLILALLVLMRMRMRSRRR